MKILKTKKVFQILVIKKSWEETNINLENKTKILFGNHLDFNFYFLKLSLKISFFFSIVFYFFYLHFKSVSKLKSDFEN